MPVKRLVVPIYLVAILLILFPLLDTVLSVLPLRMSDVAWRFGASGLLSRALIVPILGVLLAVAGAVIAEHRIAQRLLGGASAMLALVLLGLAGLFVLDAVQVRSQVRAEAITAFDVASAVALGKMLAGACVGMALAIATLRSRAAEPAPARSARGTAAWPLVGRN